MLKLRTPAIVNTELAQIRKDAVTDRDQNLVIEINLLPESSVLRAQWIADYRVRCGEA